MARARVIPRDHVISGTGYLLSASAFEPRENIAVCVERYDGHRPTGIALPTNRFWLTFADAGVLPEPSTSLPTRRRRPRSGEAVADWEHEHRVAR